MDELEKAYQILLDYEKEVKELLLYVCGWHNERDNSIWVQAAKITSKELSSKQSNAYKIMNVLYDLSTKSLLPEDQTIVDQYDRYFLTATRNISCWLYFINMNLDFYSD